MSVIGFGKVEIVRMCKEVLRQELLTINDFMDKQQQETFGKYFKLTPTIRCFFDRLFIGNQMVFMYQYNDNGKVWKIEHLDPADFKGRHRKVSDLHRELRSLDYNLYSNGGSAFTSIKDFAILTKLIDSTRKGLD